MNIPITQSISLLRGYLAPQMGRVWLLAGLLIGGVALQLVSPQILRRFIDTVVSSTGISSPGIPSTGVSNAGAAATNEVGSSTVANGSAANEAVTNGLSGGLSALLLMGFLFLVVVLIERAATIATTYVSQHLAWTATNGLRRDLTQHVLQLDMGFHNAHTPGELLERIDGDVDGLANFFSEFLLQILTGLLLTAGVLILLYREDWRIGAVLTLFVIAYMVVHYRGQQMAAPYWEKEREYTAEMVGFTEERVAGVRDIQTSGAVAYTNHRFNQVLRKRAWQALVADVITDVGWTVSKIFYDAGTAVGMALGAYLFYQGQITLGTVYLIISYLGLLNGPLNRIAHQLEDLQRVRVSVNRVSQLTATQSKIVSGTRDSSSLDGPLAVGFDSVSFAYNPDAPVLRAVSFDLAPGETLGLLGRTGSGKTTIGRLLFRLYDLDEGEIRLVTKEGNGLLDDGVNVRDFRVADLRARIGMVTQEVQLFQATVRDNLTLFAPHITDDAIMASLTQLGLDRWARELPGGLDTQLSVGGAVAGTARGSANSSTGLSAGEGQLLALARVFLKDPGLVILDEASSRLDPATEQLLEKALDELLRDRTSIIIAHRLSTVKRADKILILEDGVVKEMGSYSALADDPESAFSNLLRTGLADLDLISEEVPNA